MNMVQDPNTEQRKRRSTIVLALVHAALAVGVLVLFVYMQTRA